MAINKQSHTFDISKLATLPPVIPSNLTDDEADSSDAPSASRRSRYTRSSDQEDGKDEVQQATIYQKYFEKNYGAGEFTRMKSMGGLLSRRVEGLEESLKRFQKDRSGRGKNFSDKDIKFIGDRIKDALHRIPGRIIDSASKDHIPPMDQKRLRARLYSDMKKGLISESDLKDAEEIIKNIKI